MHITNALKTLGYFTIPIAVRDSLSELKRTLAPFSTKTAFVFNNCDGFNGSNKAAAKVIRLVESLGFRHTGSNAYAVKYCIDKSRMKQKLAAARLPTPRYQVFTTPQGLYRYSFPAIIKPLTDDGSVGIDLHSVVQNHAELMERVKYIIEHHRQPALVEEYVLGRELTVSVWGNHSLQALPISEQDYSRIRNPLHRILTYESKWNPDSYHYQNIATHCPAPLSVEETRRVADTALRVFRTIGLRDFARIDIRYHNDTPYVIDINEVPDLGPGSGFSVAATAAGFSYAEMIAHLLEIALEREGWKCPLPVLKSLSPHLQMASVSSD